MFVLAWLDFSKRATEKLLTAGMSPASVLSGIPQPYAVLEKLLPGTHTHTQKK